MLFVFLAVVPAAIVCLFWIGSRINPTTGHWEKRQVRAEDVAAPLEQRYGVGLSRENKSW